MIEIKIITIKNNQRINQNNGKEKTEVKWIPSRLKYKECQ